MCFSSTDSIRLWKFCIKVKHLLTVCITLSWTDQQANYVTCKPSPPQFIASELMLYNKHMYVLLTNLFMVSSGVHTKTEEQEKTHYKSVQDTVAALLCFINGSFRKSTMPLPTCLMFLLLLFSICPPVLQQTMQEVHLLGVQKSMILVGSPIHFQISPYQILCGISFLWLLKLRWGQLRVCFRIHDWKKTALRWMNSVFCVVQMNNVRYLFSTINLQERLFK